MFNDTNHSNNGVERKITTTKAMCATDSLESMLAMNHEIHETSVFPSLDFAFPEESEPLAFPSIEWLGDDEHVYAVSDDSDSSIESFSSDNTYKALSSALALIQEHSLKKRSNNTSMSATASSCSSSSNKRRRTENGMVRSKAMPCSLASLANTNSSGIGSNCSVESQHAVKFVLGDWSTMLQAREVAENDSMTTCSLSKTSHNISSFNSSLLAV